MDITDLNRCKCDFKWGGVDTRLRDRRCGEQATGEDRLCNNCRENKCNAVLDNAERYFHEVSPTKAQT